ncbi:MAG TPA: hypothetical protein VGN88_12525 [Phycisphaerae bacterium]
MANAENDPEIKARLGEQVNAMDIYLLVHPPGLSLNVKEASLEQVCAALTEQFRGDPVIFSGGDSHFYPPGQSGTERTFSLRVENLPFWEIFDRLNQQHPIGIERPNAGNRSDQNDNVRLTTGGMPIDYKIVDAFAMSLDIAETGLMAPPRVLSWGLTVKVDADPRVRISAFSPLRVDVITDQDGKSLLPLISSHDGMASYPSSVCSWTSGASLAGIPTAHQIKELRGTIAVSVVAKEKIVTRDLTKEIAPVDTPRGRITIQKTSDNNLIARYVYDNVDGSRTNASVFPATVILRAFDKNGELARTTDKGQGGMVIESVNAPLASIRLSWTEKTLPFILPVEFKNVELPGNPLPEANDPVVPPK